MSTLGQCVLITHAAEMLPITSKVPAQPTSFLQTAVALAIALAPTSAQATETWCAVTEKTADGFVNLRVGPGASYRIIAQVFPSDLLLIDTAPCREFEGTELCDQSGAWVFVEGVATLNQRSRGESFQGWINSHFIRQVACDD